ncbi:MAG TPA: HAMP domain-containing sensor histidine kinase [Pedococcus sp.]|nr:HAMP domain-containing sensor histidine kinase [Pedococcus sp.]
MSAEHAGLRRARRMLALQALGGVIVGVLVVGLVTVAFVVLAQNHTTDSELRALAAAPQTTALPAGTWVVTVAADGQRVASAGAPTGLPRPEQQRRARTSGSDVVEETYVGAREYRTLTRPVDGSVVQAGVDLAPIEEERQRVLAALALAAAIACAVAAWLGTLLARRALTVWDEALARQRQFIADASHELRTPLARLALRSELLDRDLRAAGVPEPVLRDVTLLRQDSATLAEVMEDLLHAAEVSDRPDAGELVDVSEVVGDALALCQVVAEDRGLRLEATIEQVAAVRGSQPALRRVVDALVDNAMRYARTRVQVLVAPGEQGEVVLTVADDGPGLSSADPQQVFRRFARDDRSSSGFGLGLALVRDVVHRHGGSVDVESSEAGARFVVHLPAEVVDAEIA